MKPSIHEYEDMLNIKWPGESLRPKMLLSDRAKIFLPFAALKGYEESLELIRQDINNNEDNSTESFSQN